MFKDMTLELAIELIKRASVTPDDKGCQTLIKERLSKKGFQIDALPFGEGDERVENLWAVHGSEDKKEPVLCFLGHTDVVPPGDLAQWSSPPFEPTLKEGYLYGRGSADMKGSVAAMVVACENFIDKHPHHKGKIAILLTSDEEGPSRYGIKAVVEHFKAIEQPITWAIVGEPSSEQVFGDMIKQGRRGSLGGILTVHGKQGHIAYPHLAANPIALALPALKELTEYVWDKGNADFSPTQFQISNIQAGTGATNVIPSALTVVFNFRFSPESTPEGLQETLEDILKYHGLSYTLKWNLSGLSFITPKEDILVQTTLSVLKEEGINTKLSTSGGTSDGRFLGPLGTKVIELGPVNETIHQVNECIKVEDLTSLTRIYEKLLEKLLA